MIRYATMQRGLAAGLLCLGLTSNVAAGGEWSGYVGGEYRLFPQNALDTRQHDGNLSLVAEVQYHTEWDEARKSFTVVPFIRIDQGDPERSHVDLREFLWQHFDDDWELRLGLGKVFWGVTESQHLVDIINQTDLVEDPDGEDKLGQPMLNLALIRDWGTVDLFLLPGFRERRYPGVEGRLRPALPVDSDNATYESSAGDKHLDWALRWSHALGDWDIGLSHFSGTARDPVLRPALDGVGRPVLRPHYVQIEQTGLDLQATKGDWLWKLEIISREQPGGRHTALTGGFEYTLVGFRDSSTDLGLLAEYLFDDRGDSSPHPLEDEVFLGTRWAFNDAQSTEILAGVILDLEGDSRLYNLEASRRLGDSWKLSVNARIWSGVDAADPFTGFRNDDYLQVELLRYF